MPRRHRTMKGGFLDSLSNTFSNWGSSISQGASSMWEKTKNTTSSLTGTTPSTSASPSTSYQSPMSTSTYGGRHRRSRRHMRGGFHNSTPTTGLVVHAAPITDIKMAQPKTTVGGRTRRRGRKGGFIGEVVNQAVVPVTILAMQQKFGSKKRHSTRRRHK